MYATNDSVCLYQAWWKQVSIGLEWGLTDFSNVYKDLFPLEVLKTKFASLLIRFIMTICGKCKISSVDFSQCLLRNVFESELLGGGGGGGGATAYICYSYLCTCVYLWVFNN